jgi:hypothetical protein
VEELHNRALNLAPYLRVSNGKQVQLETVHGEPVRNKFKDWCRQAELPNCSVHGRAGYIDALAEWLVLSDVLEM